MAIILVCCNISVFFSSVKMLQSLRSTSLSNQSFNGVSHNMRSNEKGDIMRLNVLYVNVRETSCLEVFPRCSGDDASVPKKEPQAFQHMLEEVRPGRWIWNDVFQKVEGPSLKDAAKKNRFHHETVTTVAVIFFFFLLFPLSSQLLLKCTQTTENTLRLWWHL